MLQDFTLNSTTKTAEGLATILDKNTESITNLVKSFNGLSNVVGKTLKDVKTQFKGLVDSVSKFDDGIIKTSRSLGQSLVMARTLETQFGRVSENIIKIGGDLDDVYRIYKDISSELGRTVYLSEEMLTNVALLESAGIAKETINSFTKLYDTIGGTFDESTKQQMLLVNQAKSYGLNVGQFMTAVAGQLTKINQYGFPNGVKDLGEMVSRSKMLGMNMETAMSFADRIMSSPETAMDVAAQLQTLGGSFASLGDPMELLYLAQNDLAGLNDKLINATRGLATFNKETGQFEIGVNERLRIKQVATQFGMDANSMIETSLKLAKQEEVLKRLDLSGAIKKLGPEEQKIISSFAQLGKDGKVTLEGKDINTIKPNDVDNILKKIQGASSQFITEGVDAQKNNIEMVQKNMSSIEQVTVAQNLFRDGITLATIQTEGFAKKLDSIGDIAAQVTNELTLLKTGLGEKLLTTLSTGVKAVSAVSLGKGSETLSKIISSEDKMISRVELSSEKPVKITLDTSFNISDVVKNALATAVNERIAAEVQAQLDKRATPSGTVNRYSTSTTSGG